MQLRLISWRERPVLSVTSRRDETIKYGFEGGRVVKCNGHYHLFTSEMVGNPMWVNMRLGYWTSRDRVTWTRQSTLFSSSGDFTGHDARAALWSPMPIYSEQEQRWNLFYVAYRAAPNTADAWRINYEGRIWRSVSTIPGYTGIGGPYEDVGVVLEPNDDTQWWEGLQGTDSFYPYLVQGQWYALYGSAKTESLPIQCWNVGVAIAPQLAGPWKRHPTINPLQVEPRFIENPVVTAINDHTYIAVYDCDTPQAIGWMTSNNGIDWERQTPFIVQPRGEVYWADRVRTPLGLIPETENVYTLFYTGYQHSSLVDGTELSTTVDLGVGSIGLGSIGFVEVQLDI